MLLSTFNLSQLTPANDQYDDDKDSVVSSVVLRLQLT